MSKPRTNRAGVHVIDTPKSATTAADPNKFGPEAFEVVRTELASRIGGNVNFAVKMAAEHFAPRKPADVAAEEIRKALDELTGKAKVADTNGRLPLEGEAQTNWDNGRWEKKVSVAGLRRRYEAEIKAGTELTTEQIDVYARELEAEKAKIAELVDERDDIGSEPVACRSYFAEQIHKDHSGTPVEFVFQPKIRFRVERNTDSGSWQRKKHPMGDAFIEVGNFFYQAYVPADTEKGTAEMLAAKVPFCDLCKEEAWKVGREEGQKVTFYTLANVERKMAAITRAQAGKSAMSAQLSAQAEKKVERRFSNKTERATGWKTSKGRR